MKDSLRKFGEFISDCASIAKHRKHENKKLDLETQRILVKCFKLFNQIFEYHLLWYRCDKANLSDYHNIVEKFMNKIQSYRKEFEGKDGVSRSGNDVFIYYVIEMIKNFNNI